MARLLSSPLLPVLLKVGVQAVLAGLPRGLLGKALDRCVVAALTRCSCSGGCLCSSCSVPWLYLRGYLGACWVKLWIGV